MDNAVAPPHPRAGTLPAAKAASAARHGAGDSSLFEAVLATVADGVLTLDGGNTIQSASPSIAAIFGYSHEEIVGQHLSLLISPSSRDKFFAELDQRLTAEGAVSVRFDRELVGCRKDESPFPMKVCVHGIRVGQRPICAVLICDPDGHNGSPSHAG